MLALAMTAIIPVETVSALNLSQKDNICLFS